MYGDGHVKWPCCILWSSTPICHSLGTVEEIPTLVRRLVEELDINILGCSSVGRADGC